jgi:hypothetical protein
MKCGLFTGLNEKSRARGDFSTVDGGNGGVKPVKILLAYGKKRRD